MYFDTHAHLDDARFDGDREALLERMRAEGIDPCMTVGANMEMNEKAVARAQRYPGTLYAAVGIHPTDAPELTEEALGRLRAPGVNFLRPFTGLRKNQHAVGTHLHKALRGEGLFPGVLLLDAQHAHHKRHDERRMPGQHGELPVGRGDGERLHLPLEKLALWREDFQRILG